ncbi:MAG TPA: hypothetical protein VF637_12185 [Sphingomicrobium sp.]|jgi:hypothetical protein
MPLYQASISRNDSPLPIANFDFLAESDHAAVDRMPRLMPEMDLEIWLNDRLVALIDQDETSDEGRTGRIILRRAD